MRSSTFNFERAVPEGPWGRAWIFAVVLFAVAMGLFERGFRARGMVPDIVDDEALWAYHRGRVYAGGEKTLILVGGSRLQLGADLEVLRARLPDHEIVQLAIDGKTPVAALRDLAEDGRVRGTVLVDVAEHALERSYWQDQQRHVLHHRDQKNLTANLERRASSLMQSHFVVVNPYVGFNNLLESLLARGSLPRPNYVTTRADRSRTADYSMIDVPAHRAQRVARVRAAYRAKPPPSPEAWLEDARRVGALADKLRARGVRVAFLRMPSTGEHWQADAERYPRAKYWDAFAATLKVPAIHFKDEPALDQFELPDTSHLDKKDTTPFTHCLVDVLAKKNLVEGATGASACAQR